MKTNIIDKSLMMIFLLEECNLNCAHCARQEEPMTPGYKLSVKQLRRCLDDCGDLKSIDWVHFSGGEPTLWSEENHSLVDLLREIAGAGYTPGFTSNGGYFADYDRCRDFFAKYLDSTTVPVRLYLSIDVFHGNFDRKKGRAPSLDNVLRFKQGLSGNKKDLIDVKVLTVISRESRSLLTSQMTDHYQSQGVTFVFVPLYPRGKATSFLHLCPDLESENPEDWGAFGQFCHPGERRRRAKLRDWVDHIILIGDKYYFDDPWRIVGELGHLPDAIVRAYSETGQSEP